MEAIALHDFERESPDELSFRAGDRLIIFDYGSKNEWHKAELNGVHGQVPGNYIQVQKPRWFVGHVSRFHAEKILSNEDLPDGSFLIRVSESSPNEFSLSVRYHNSVQHFRILKDPDCKFFLWKKSFKTLNELVDNYRHETVSQRENIFLRDIEEPEPRYVQAKYDFPSRPNEILEDNELPFKEGDIIQLLKSEDENWWAGRIGDREGYFPASYVKSYVVYE